MCTFVVYTAQYVSVGVNTHDYVPYTWNWFENIKNNNNNNINNNNNNNINNNNNNHRHPCKVCKRVVKILST